MDNLSTVDEEQNKEKDNTKYKDILFVKISQKKNETSRLVLIYISFKIYVKKMRLGTYEHSFGDLRFSRQMLNFF